MAVGERDERPSQAGKVLSGQEDYIASLKEETGVDGILAGRAPVDEACRILIVQRDGFCEQLDQGNRDVSRERRLFGNCTDIEWQGFATFRDFVCGTFGDRSGLCFGPSESGFEAKNGSDTRIVGEQLLEFVVREKIGKKSHAPCALRIAGFKAS